MSAADWEESVVLIGRVVDRQAPAACRASGGIWRNPAESPGFSLPVIIVFPLTRVRFSNIIRLTFIGFPMVGRTTMQEIDLIELDRRVRRSTAHDALFDALAGLSILAAVCAASLFVGWLA